MWMPDRSWLRQRSRSCLEMIAIPWLLASNGRSTDCFPGQQLWPDNTGEAAADDQG